MVLPQLREGSGNLSKVWRCPGCHQNESCLKMQMEQQAGEQAEGVYFLEIMWSILKKLHANAGKISQAIGDQ